MSYNRRSRLITQGIARSPNRAMLRAVGFGDDDFDKPIVGVANGHSTMTRVRLQKFLAEAGVASRRASEQVILAGRVRVNDKVVRQLGSKVDPDRDTVAVDGKVVQAKRKLYLALHKPRGCVCSAQG